MFIAQTFADVTVRLASCLTVCESIVASGVRPDVCLLEGAQAELLHLTLFDNWRPLVELVAGGGPAPGQSHLGQAVSAQQRAHGAAVSVVKDAKTWACPRRARTRSRRGPG